MNLFISKELHCHPKIISCDNFGVGEGLKLLSPQQPFFIYGIVGIPTDISSDVGGLHTPLIGRGRRALSERL